MAYEVTPNDVTSGFDTQAQASEIVALICLMNGADACMEAQGVPNAVGVLLKTYAIRHMLSGTANGGAGQVVSQTAIGGASRTFKATGTSGFGSTPSGALLEQLDRWGCVTAILSGNPGIFMASVGPRRR